MGMMDYNRKVFIDTNILIYASLKKPTFTKHSVGLNDSLLSAW
jgi:predicted nucleic acid-binding protein